MNFDIVNYLQIGLDSQKVLKALLTQVNHTSESEEFVDRFLLLDIDDACRNCELSPFHTYLVIKELVEEDIIVQSDDPNLVNIKIRKLLISAMQAIESELSMLVDAKSEIRKYLRLTEERHQSS